MRHVFSSFFLTALLLGVLVLTGCDDGRSADGEDEGPRQSAIRVETLVLEPTSFEDVIELNGSVEALGDASLSAQASGTVTSLAARGAFVQAGQVVAQLDPQEARAAVEQAEAQVESARAQFELAQDNFQRQEPLYRDSIISAVEFENVRAQLNQARANLRQSEAALEQARDRLAKTRVTAPFTGTVEERFVEQGEQVSPGEPVARVLNTSRVRIAAGVPERYAPDIDEGTEVRVELRARPGAPEIGRVTFVGNAVDPQSRTFPIEVELPNPDGQLKPEMVARLYVTRQQLTDAIVVPRAAILRDEQGTNVYAVNRTDTTAVAELRAVTVGPQYGDRAVIESGLAAGDEVVIAGQNNLSRGDRVDVATRHERLQTATEAAPGASDAQ